MATRSRAAAAARTGDRPGTISVTSHASEPVMRPPARAGSEAGLDRRGLADPRRADDDEQPLALEDLEHLGDGALATVEVLGVGLLEGLQAAIRVRVGMKTVVGSTGTASASCRSAASSSTD